MTWSGSGSTPPTTWSPPPRPSSATRCTWGTGPAWSTAWTGRVARSAGGSRPTSTATSTPARSCPAPRWPTSSGERIVFIGAGKTLYALDAVDGDERWRHELGEAGNVDEPTEIESSPVVVGDTVIVGYDVHNTPGYRAGLVAFAATTGELLWDFDPDAAGGQAGAGTGCVDVWSSPSVDEARGLVFAATGNCPTSPDGLGRPHRGHLRPRPRDRRARLGLPAPRAQQRRPGLRRLPQPVPRRGPGRGRAGQQGRPLLRGRPGDRGAGLAGRGHPARARAARLQLLDRGASSGPRP